MRDFDTTMDSMKKEEFEEYDKAFKTACARCLGEEGDCICCIARISYYTMRSENRVWEWGA